MVGCSRPLALRAPRAGHAAGSDDIVKVSFVAAHGAGGAFELFRGPCIIVIARRGKLRVEVSAQDGGLRTSAPLASPSAGRWQVEALDLPHLRPGARLIPQPDSIFRAEIWLCVSVSGDHLPDLDVEGILALGPNAGAHVGGRGD